MGSLKARDSDPPAGQPAAQRAASGRGLEAHIPNGMGKVWVGIKHVIYM